MYFDPSTFFLDLFKAENDLRYRMAGLEKTKKKRGRPPKPTPEVLKAQELAAAEVRRVKNVILFLQPIIILL